MRIQGYTGTDNVYIAKQGFWASVPYIISTILSAALVVAFANLLPKEIYGTYRYILSIAGLLSFLTLTGMNTAITR
ncbi:MAG: oligosaccharide flippase family protein, partial [Patescibacteria group bacterium]